MSLSGPMFEPSSDDSMYSVSGKSGAHYNVYHVHPEAGMRVLREFFPTGQADDLNFVLFSTSGIHGSYSRIEDIGPGEEQDDCVTFVIVHPRIVCMRYGNAKPETPEDIDFLKKLRQSSWKAVQRIGR